jgi:transposase InsO family protein
VKQYYTAKELVGLPDLPTTERSINRSNYPRRKRQQGKGWEYHIDGLPTKARAELIARQISQQNNAETLAFAGQYTAQVKAKEEASKPTPEAPVMFTGNAAKRCDAKMWIIGTIEAIKTNGKCTWPQALETYNSAATQKPEWVTKIHKTVSLPSLERWRKKLKQKGSNALAGNYGNRRGQTLIDSQEKLKELVVSMLISYPHIDPIDVHRGCQARFADGTIKIPSKSSLARWVNNWKNQNAEVFTACTNPDKWKNEFMIAHGDASANIVRLNQRWEADSSPADIHCADGRHALVQILDVYSRRCYFLVTPTSQSEAICLAIRHCIKAWGMPEELKTDQGKDYKATRLVRVLDFLNIQHNLSQAFCPWEKAHVERNFRSFLHSAYIEMAPGYAGHNVNDAQALRAAQSFADRLFKKNEVVQTKLTGAELQKLCDEYCETYHRRQHSELKCSPLQKVADYRDPVTFLDSSEQVLDLLMSTAPGLDGMRTVQKKGIKHDNDWFIGPAIAALDTGTRVFCLCDPNDIGRLHVYLKDGDILNPVGVAECANRLGFNPKEMAITGKQMHNQRINEEKQALRKAAKAINTNNIIEEIRAQDRKNNGVVALPAPSSTVQTPATAAITTGLKPQQTSANTGYIAAEIAAAEKAAEQQPETLVFPTAKTETGEDRYNKWLSIENRLIKAQDVTDEELHYHKKYRETLEWQTHKETRDAFPEFYAQ